MKNNLTLSNLLSLTDDQKIEAFERLANIFMSTTDPEELNRDITYILELCVNKEAPPCKQS